jgi:uncharacterized membrane protein YdjX (TVP38/TMEM64 family)
LRWRIALLLMVPAVLGLAWALGVFEALDVDALASLVRDSGPLAPLLFVLALALSNGLGVPAVLFVLTAIAVWPPVQAFLVLWTGSVGAGLVGYAFARSLGRSWVEPRLPLFLRNLDDRASRNALRTVVMVRVGLYLLAPSHWALGLSSIRPGALLLGSLIGFAPMSALWAFAGGGMVSAMRSGSPAAWVGLGIVMVAGLVLVPRWLQRRPAAHTDA